MTDRLDEIRKRAEAATLGPWEDCGIQDGAGSPIRDGVTGFIGRVETILCEAEANYQASANMSFIAHAREDIPWLIAEVERLRERVAAEQVLQIKKAVKSDD